MTQSRIAAIEKEIRELNERALQSMPTPKKTEPPRSPVMPIARDKISAWNELQSQVRDDMALRQLSEPSALRVDADDLVVTHRSIDRLRASLLTGAGMLVAMIILTIAVNPSRRAGGRSGRTDLTER